MAAHTVIVFFGEMGSGKSYTGARFARCRGYEFFEGDSVVTHELLDRSGRFKPIPRGVIREFVDVLMRATVDRAATEQDTSFAEKHERPEYVVPVPAELMERYARAREACNLADAACSAIESEIRLFEAQQDNDPLPVQNPQPKV